MPSIASRRSSRPDASSLPGAPTTRFLRLAPILLPTLAFLLYALTLPGLARGDAAGGYVTAAALVERGRPAIDGWTGALAPAPHGAEAPPSDYGPLAYAAGHFYHDAPPGPALLAAPLYALGLLLAPPFGPVTPAALVALLGPLLGALIVAAVPRCWRLLGSDLPVGGARAFTAASALLVWPLTAAPTAPIVAAALLAGLLLLFLARWREPVGPATGLVAGAGMGALLLVDYLLGALAVVVLCLVLLDMRRRPRVAFALLVGAALPVTLLAAYQTVAFGLPWRPAFRFAVDPAARSPRTLIGDTALFAAALPLVWPVVVDQLSHRLASRRVVGPVALYAVLIGVPLILVVASFPRSPDPALPLDWGAAEALLPLLLVAAGLALVLALAGWASPRPSPRPSIPAALLLLPLPLLVLPPILPPDSRLARLPAGTGAVPASAVGENYVSPFAMAVGTGQRPLWALLGGAVVEPSGALRLPQGAEAISPKVDITSGVAYHVWLRHGGDVRANFAWEDASGRPVAVQAAERSGGGELAAEFAAPPAAAGLRLLLAPGAGGATVTDLHLGLVRGARVEPFPAGKRAALAFSFDWESAMGGLIHSRSAAAGGEGEGSQVTVGVEGAPSVGQAEEKALRMREGARFLAERFAAHGIRATFYSTGYNLLPGNPTCEKFLGNPVYRNADRAHGWGSDYWRTHPWYEHDPCTTEERAPAWYFASETRALAAAGHEIASHSFGHLYVRGVSPAELEADLAQWNRAAEALGVPIAPTFAFPWTSSNSIDAPFFAVFERLGLTVLTRMYQPSNGPPSYRPFELDRVRENPALAIFPDQYLPSKPEELDRAIAGIDEVLARRGYFSLWTHPNEVLEQGGQVIWSRIIDHAAAARDRGLWVAPVSEIAGYSLATRELSVTALPLAGGTRLTVENRSDRRLEGVTLTLPHDHGVGGEGAVTGRQPAEVTIEGGQLRLPPLSVGQRIVVQLRGAR